MIHLEKMPGLKVHEKHVKTKNNAIYYPVCDEPFKDTLRFSGQVVQDSHQIESAIKDFGRSTRLEIDPESGKPRSSPEVIRAAGEKFFQTFVTFLQERGIIRTENGQIFQTENDEDFARLALLFGEEAQDVLSLFSTGDKILEVLKQYLTQDRDMPALIRWPFIRENIIDFANSSRFLHTDTLTDILTELPQGEILPGASVKPPPLANRVTYTAQFLSALDELRVYEPGEGWLAYNPRDEEGTSYLPVNRPEVKLAIAKDLDVAIASMLRALAQEEIQALMDNDFFERKGIKAYLSSNPTSELNQAYLQKSNSTYTEGAWLNHMLKIIGYRRNDG